VFLSDEGQKPVPAAGYKGTVILVVGGKPAFGLSPSATAALPVRRLPSAGSSVTRAGLPPTTSHETAGQHGGRVADAGKFHVELVAKGETVDVFLSDGARPRPCR
jgi:hypothetical protein